MYLYWITLVFKRELINRIACKLWRVRLMMMYGEIFVVFVLFLIQLQLSFPLSCYSAPVKLYINRNMQIKPSGAGCFCWLWATTLGFLCKWWEFDICLESSVNCMCKHQVANSLQLRFLALHTMLWWTSWTYAFSSSYLIFIPIQSSCSLYILEQY